MIESHFRADLREAQQRAARIRASWSATEQVTRTGLPPDLPLRLRRLIFGRSGELQPAYLCIRRGTRRDPRGDG
jgi:hypothetical protein